MTASLRDPRILIGVLSALAVLALAVPRLQRKVPGELTLVHGQHTDLQGASGCKNCHGGWFSDMATACVACHRDIESQIKDRRGLHGRLQIDSARSCALCHSDHNGAGFAIVNRQSFAAAGFASREAFTHDSIGWPMAGRHLQLDCARCHAHADQGSLQAGQKRFLSLSRNCASCHDDAHEGRMQIACTSCHGQESFTELVASRHEHLPLTHAHGKVGCLACHQKDGPHALEALGARLPEVPASNRTCADCHRSPHSEPFLQRIADSLGQTVGGAFGNVCSTCHSTEHESFQSQAAIANTIRLEIVKAAHQELALPLTGRHAQLECNACHGTEKARFAVTGRRCDDCHADAHAGFFARRGSIAASTGQDRGSCVVCHQTERFDVIRDGLFAHQTHTGFALHGAHAQLGCEACHPRSETADATGRRFGRATQIRRRNAGDRPFSDCAVCHVDPHGIRFDGKDRQPIDGRTGCVRCHVETSFRTLPHGFDHALWTGFDITGAHEKAGCSACHTPLSRPDANGRTWLPAKGKRCAECHQDPHAGQFERATPHGRGTDCGRCHTSQTTFANLSFRHNLDARFRLGDAHRSVPCRDCHRPESMAGASVVRYRPIPHQCTDCHGDPRGPFRNRRPGAQQAR